MGLFGNPRKKIEKWAPLVMEGYVPGMPIDEEFLDAATTLYIQQHARVLYDSISLVLTSKNEQTRKERYALAQKHFAALVKIKNYASKEQKKGINQALDDFLKMEDAYKHPRKISEEQRKANKRQMKQDFWDVYAQGEMMDIFSGEDK